MPQNNLRIIYNNLADTSTITPSSTGGTTSASNLKNETKTSVWRTGTHSGLPVKANIVVSFGSLKNVGGVILPHTNASSSALIRVRAYTGAAPTMAGTIDSPTVSTPGTLVYDTTTINACDYLTTNEAASSTGLAKYYQGNSRSVRAWFPSNVECSSILIEILDGSATELFFEASKLIVGPYWSPKFNTGFGAGVGFNDMTSVSRMASGNQEVVLGPRFKSLNFELKWLDGEDRTYMRQLLQQKGKSSPFYVSLFPQVPQLGTVTQEELDREVTYSIYGRLSEVSALVNSTFTFYSNSIQLEEV